MAIALEAAVSAALLPGECFVSRNETGVVSGGRCVLGLILDNSPLPSPRWHAAVSSNTSQGPQGHSAKREPIFTYKQRGVSVTVFERFARMLSQTSGVNRVSASDSYMVPIKAGLAGLEKLDLEFLRHPQGGTLSKTDSMSVAAVEFEQWLRVAPFRRAGAMLEVVRHADL